MKSASLPALAGLVAVGCLAWGPANATVYSFTVNLSSGPNTGTLTGTVDLAFVGGGGSGTGAASSLTLTSIPSSFGGLANMTPTSWAQQLSNSFTVTSGAVTSFAYFAATGGSSATDDAFAINSTASSIGSVGSWASQPDLNELSKTVNKFGYNFGGFQGVSFTQTKAVPEPSTWAALLVGFAGLGLAAYRRSTKRAAIA